MSGYRSKKEKLLGLKSLSFVLMLILFLISFSDYPSSAAEGVKNYRTVQITPEQRIDHDSTAFPLLGAHRSLECGKCHSSGKYRGTPRTCDTCHNGQISYGKPAGHLMTTQNCLVCHSINYWSPSNFIHDPSTAGQCSNCHNGQQATGKPANHVSTAFQCDACHKTSGWIPAGFNHASIGAQLCSSCHKAGGIGLPPKSDTLHNFSGLPDCRQCHSSTSSFSTWVMNHSGISPPLACTTCHLPGNNMGALYKPSGHPATTQDCGACHNTTTFND